jgi:hypothetical protein
MTTGLMEWGQAGSYNAPDDRRVISALVANRAPGMVKAVTLTAGTGLNVNVAAGWLAVVDCGDSTNGVVGTGSALVVPGSAGDAGAPRTDSLWCDISPANGTFSVVIIPQSAETGRQGIRLATITVPTGANLASAFTLTPRAVTFGVGPYMLHADGANLNNFTAETDVPGATLTFTLATPSTLIIWAPFDTQVTAGSANAVTGFLTFDGTDHAVGVPMQLTSTAGRVAVGQVWTYPNVAAGQHTAKLRASYGGTSGQATIRGPQTSITILVIPN